MAIKIAFTDVHVQCYANCHITISKIIQIGIKIISEKIPMQNLNVSEQNLKCLSKSSHI